ncbi:MAG: signal peptidase I, partial [Planctomycetota bacterium]
DLGANNRPVQPGGAVKCRSCATEFVGDSGGYRKAHVTPLRARCPICSHVYGALAEESDIRPGNKILVNKFAYELGKPKRWDVIVFEFDQWKNYIKRLVALPGETVRLHDGDLYINGKIERKTDHPFVQDEMWLQVSDSNVVENGLNDPAWSSKGTTWAPQQERTRWSINHTAASGAPAALNYNRSFDNYLNYNLARHGVGGRNHTQIGDKLVRFEISGVEGSGWLGCEIGDGDYTFLLTLPVGSATGNASIFRIENEWTAEGPVAHPSGLRSDLPDFRLAKGTSTTIDFENVDDRLVIRVGGDEIVRLDYVSTPDIDDPPRAENRSTLRLLGSDVRATIQSIEVFQDLYYIGEGNFRSFATERWKGITLGEGQYLAMGDNSASSSDGRFWGYVPESNLMGKALLVFWPAWPLNFQCKFIK